ncbi:MAG: hypothetical protein HC826_00455 [Rhodospirillales bacterium]|nr:hypothetical protein [Rhodospirillales bacterium]
MIISTADKQSNADSSAAESGDVVVVGTDYNATGEVPCTVAGAAGSCAFGVEREGDGSGIVTVTKPDGKTRAIFSKMERRRDRMPAPPTVAPSALRKPAIRRRSASAMNATKFPTRSSSADDDIRGRRRQPSPRSFRVLGW